MLTNKKNPSVFAGLVAALSLGATLSVAPSSVLASEKPSVAVSTYDLTAASFASDGDAAAQADPICERNVCQAASAEDGVALEAGETSDPSGFVDSADGSETDGSASIDDASGDVSESGLGDESFSNSSLDSEFKSDDSDGLDSDLLEGPAVDPVGASNGASANQALNSSYSSIEEDGWHEAAEGTYYVRDGKRAQSQWLVTDSYKNYGLQRYWFDALGLLTRDALISEEDAGWWAYATDKGYVVRGRYTAADGTVYLANDDGKLEGPGWVISSSYGQGLQRYYVDSQNHGCVAGYSSDGWEHYTTSKGYVLRGSLKVGNKVYLADDDGRLARSGDSEAGWVVSSSYGHGLQRYWVQGHDGHDGGYAMVGFSNDGWAHFTTDQGYVLRGALDDNGVRRYADNDGKINNGWIVTSAFGRGLQRYWQENYRLVKNRYISADAAGWAAYATDDYTVVRGAYKVGNKVYLADNDGKLALSGESQSDWVVTSSFGQGLQRYWVEGHNGTDGGFARVGLSSSGWLHYTTDEGYVLRGYLDKEGYKRYADDKGELNDGWVVTSTFIGGGLARYYQKDGAMLTSCFFKDGGYWAYATANSAVLRGKLTVDGHLYAADDEGRLETRDGWVVDSKYDQTLERYFFKRLEQGYSYIVTGFFRQTMTGDSYLSWFYSDPSTGKILRGPKAFSNGVALADNDGRMVEASSDGWLVSSAFGQGLHRYYLQKTSTGYSLAVTGFFKGSLNVNGDVYNDYFYADRTGGYVLTGKQKFDAGMLVADQHGRLLEGLFPKTKANSFLVTGRFDGNLQRYYLIDSGGHLYAKLGKFTATDENGKTDDYYGREDQGYVVIGSYRAPNGTVYYADGDGKLIKHGWRYVDGSWYFLNRDGSSRAFSNAAKSAYEAIKNWTSETSFLICIDNNNLRTVVFQGSAGDWEPVADWLCSVGKAPTNRQEVAEGYGATVRGVFKIVNRGYIMGNDPDYFYWSEFWQPRPGEEGQRFHSRPYWRNASRTPGALYDNGDFGRAQTHGCVRLDIDGVKFIYDNCPIGTKVYSY